MLNLIRNPNINSSHLFRADISFDSQVTGDSLPPAEIPPRLTYIDGYELKTVIVRTMIPRNILLDKPLDQTCLFHEHVADSGEIKSLVTYLPHISSAAESPFYHPAVRAIGFLHTFNPQTHDGSVSIHYSFFESETRSEKLERTAQNLLAVLYRHGKGSAAGYVKRVNHDIIIPQAVVQNTYARLKARYARTLVSSWVESTDPTKHVFEDLSIAAFLIELWAEMYKDTEFPGFVDIGCGNGLLVHILLEEGYSGWGFDARRRKSWASHGSKAQENLKELVLIPSILQTSASTEDLISTSPEKHANASSELVESAGTEINQKMNQQSSIPAITNGEFPKGTFIISNHADELTPWTPILANLSQSPFIMIPCCSHDLSGAKFRAPPPKGPKESSSAYASLVAWVYKIAEDCGWVVEKEMLRIPSTRNTALIGRRREKPFKDVDLKELVMINGGAHCWEENALKLVKGAARGH
jgi:tRNASer (uridine44-2'-O)-methyltransferase